MKIPISFRIKETYKKLTKSIAIKLIQLRYGKIQPAELEEKSPGSIIILAQERYGDIIVTTPLFKMLRKNFPEIELTVIGVTEIIMFLKPDKNINHLYNIKSVDAKTKQRIFSKQYDFLYNTKDHPSFTFLYLGARIKARHKLGIYHPGHTGFFHHMIELADTAPTIEKNIALLPYLGVSTDNIQLRPYLPEGPVSKEVKQFVTKNSGRRLIGINLSASNRSKEWGPKRWEEFLSNIGEDIVIIATQDLANLKAHLEHTFAHVIAAPLTPTIYDLGYLVKSLFLLVTPDTSLVHIASCYNTPILALYRVERDLKKFKPLSQINEVLVTPTGVMDDIMPTTVLASYNVLISRVTEQLHTSDRQT